MEESLTVTNIQVSHHVPDDIILSILSKLPLKSFKRFQCVHKSWSVLFDDPYFMTIYRNNFLSKDCSYYDDTSLLVGEGWEKHPSMGSVFVSRLYSLSGENFETSVKIDWPNPFPEDEDKDDYCFGIMGSASVNGILCLFTFHLKEWKFKLILWNPTTNEFKVIPKSPFELGKHDHLLGYDRIKDDYKVIRFVECDVDYDDELVSYCEIYSLIDDLWSKIDDDVPHSSGIKKDVYMDGVSHWLNNLKNETDTYLVSFDFSNESFTTTIIPSYTYHSFEEVRDLVILNGSIAFILYYKKTSTIHISILGELGVKESWTKLFVVESSPCLNYPIVSAKKGKILLRSKDNKQNKQGLVCIDLKTGKIDTIDLTTKISGCLSCIILLHKESILPIGGL